MTRPTDDKWFLGKYTGQLIKTCMDYIATIDNTESIAINKLLDLKSTANNEDEIILADTMIGKTLSWTRHTSATATELMEHKKQLEIFHQELLELTKGEELNNIIESVGTAKVSKSFIQNSRDIVNELISSLTNALSKFMGNIKSVPAPDHLLLHKRHSKPVMKELVVNHVLKKVDTSSTDRLQKEIQHPEFKHHAKQFSHSLESIKKAGTDKIDPNVEGKSSNLQSGLRKK